jgi:DNA-binding SARP family transcriptional activator/tetratricopeptide (TPR) repeat protein
MEYRIMSAFVGAGGGGDHEVFGSWLRASRLAAGLSQEELAGRSGISVRAISDLERGRTRWPHPGSVGRLADALELDGGRRAEFVALAARRLVPSAGPAGAGAPTEHGSGLWLAVLGPLGAWRDGLRLGLGPSRQATVLGLLAMQPGELVRGETIIEALWGQQPPASAADLVQEHVSGLRRVLDPGGGDRLLEQGTAGYRLRAGAGELDAAAFGELAGRARAAAAAGDGAAACGLYARALELWRGEPAADAEGLRGHPAVAVLARQRADAVLGYADAACGLGWHARVIPLLETLAREDPLEERVHARLMVALAGTGQQAAAIGVHEGLLRRLDEELGAGPGPELAAAYQRVLRRDIPPAPAGDTAAADGPGTGTRPYSAPGVRYSLPPDTAAFTGRRAELERITAAVTEAAGTGGVVAIHAIGGMPGVGKTALAVHAAHLLKDRFPDRQLFLSLHGHTPGREPVTPGAALAGLLAAAGVDARYLPADLDGRAALWRDKMAGQQALLVLDNAASSAQVTPLLPGSEGCLVLVTSRRHLGDLPGAAPVLLEALPPREAREMFARLAPRAAASPEAVEELTELAGFLPLAVSLLARVYARHPSWTLADLAAETRARILTLAAENDNVAAAFAVSYRHLDPARQELFRRLGLHPGPVIDGYAAAALAGCSLEEAAGQLDALHGEGLLNEAGRRRYGMHDLIRRYARDLAATDPAATREQALDRLLDYYQHTATLADTLLARQARTTSPARSPQAPPAEVPQITDSIQALAWGRAERASLLACLDHATAAGQHVRVVALTAAIAALLRHDGPWTSAITRHTTAVKAARHLGDRLGQANALTNLGDVRRLTGDYGAAAVALEEALGISRDIGNRGGEANALIDLGNARRMSGDYGAAAVALEEALGIYRDIGDRLGQSNALSNLGDVGSVTGDYGAAAAALEEALDIYRDIGNRGGEANALMSLGIVRGTTGDPRGAAAVLEEALDIYRDIGNRGGEPNALMSLGVVRRMTGDSRGAAVALEEALGIYRDISDRGGEAEALNETGTLHRVRGDPGQAAEYHRQALDLAREITSPWDEAHALAGLGRCALAGGRTADAIAMLRQARDIFQRIGAAEAADTAAELDSLAGAEPATGSPARSHPSASG